MDTKGGIFLSYRREETGHVAGRLADRLIARFGEHDVFIDVDSIPPGVDFVELIQRAVQGCDVLLVMIGRQWASIADEDGRRRLDNPDDFVVLEVQAALDRGIPVVPVLVDGARLPRPEDLPESLRPLVRRNAVRVGVESFRSDVNRIIEQLTNLVPGGVATPAMRTSAAGQTGGPDSGNRSSTARSSLRLVPRQLPPDVSAFTGRVTELATLDRFLSQVNEAPPTIVVICVSGTAGVGKTALVVRWAHRVQGQFPDGTLYVDLRGYDPEEPVSSANALAAFLRTLGVSGDDIPGDLAERAACFRSLIADKRILVVLDNARSVEHIRPLLPGSRSCFTLVTSRDSLAGLVARHGAYRIDLDLLSKTDALALIHFLVGDRIDAEPAAAELIVDRCSGLPLALRVAGELACARATSRLSTLADELLNKRRRLDLFDAAGDERTAVQAVFSWSYDQLPAESARTFRLLGIAPLPDFTGEAVAALSGCAFEDAEKLLDKLARAHLLERHHGDRYIMHDLLQTYSAAISLQKDDDDERTLALTRLFDHYLYAAARAMDVAFPADRGRRPHIRPPQTAMPAFDTADAARLWLDNERHTLVVLFTYSARKGWPQHTVDGAAVLWRYLHNGAFHGDAMTLHTCAADAARLTGDARGEATALTNEGSVLWRWGRYREAADRYERSLAIFQRIGDPNGTARALMNLGAVHSQWGNYNQAEASCREAINAFRRACDQTGEARTLDNLGAIYQRQGRYPEAAEQHRLALAICRDIGDRGDEARALDNLGLVFQRQGRYDEAFDNHSVALAICREIGDRAGEGAVFESLGMLEFRQGNYKAASLLYEQALDMNQNIGGQGQEAGVLNGLGEALFAIGRAQEAEERHRLALEKSSITGDRFEQARALDGLASVEAATDNTELARQHWLEALALYRQIGVPEVADVADRLAITGGPSH